MKTNGAINYKMLDILFSEMDLDQTMDEINHIREYLHGKSAFKNEPVDFVRWIKSVSAFMNGRRDTLC